MRITIVDKQMNVVVDVFEIEDIDIKEEFTNFLSSYRHLGYIWFITENGNQPKSFPHNKRGIRVNF